MKFVQVDSYGACLKNTNGLEGRYYKDNNTVFMFKQLKTEVARLDYKFTLVLFNQDCDYIVRFAPRCDEYRQTIQVPSRKSETFRYQNA